MQQPRQTFGINSHGLQWHGRVTDLPEEAQVEACLAWLRERREHVTKAVSRVSSYQWKHTVEDTVGRYVSNGAFLEAARRFGLRLAPIEHERLNARVNLSKHALQDLRALRAELPESPPWQRKLVLATR